MAFDAGLADRIRVVLTGTRGVSERKMFGGLAFLVDGHMACGVVKSELMLRLGDTGAAAAVARPHARPMDFTGKPMKSMIYVGAEGIDSDGALGEWVGMAVGFVKTLPPMG